MDNYFCDCDTKEKVIEGVKEYIVARLSRLSYYIDNFSIVDDTPSLLLLSCPCHYYDEEQNDFKEDKLSMHIEWPASDNSFFLTNLTVDVYSVKSGAELFAFSFNHQNQNGFYHAVLQNYMDITVNHEREILNDTININNTHSLTKRI